MHPTTELNGLFFQMMLPPSYPGLTLGPMSLGTMPSSPGKMALSSIEGFLSSLSASSHILLAKSRKLTSLKVCQSKAKWGRQNKAADDPKFWSRRRKKGYDIG